MYLKSHIAFAVIGISISTGVAFVWFTGATASSEVSVLSTEALQGLESGSISHQFIERYQAADKAILVDIRTPEEYAAGHIPGAINIDFYTSSFIRDLTKLAEGDTELHIYCRSGNRTGHTLKTLKAQDVVVYELLGGILSYRGELQK